jgi:hypothetical protein
MGTLLQKITALPSNSSFRLFAKLGIILGLFFISKSVFAMGDDLLEGTTTQALATINKTGRNWAYIIDGAISLGAFAKTKNPFVFFSVLAVALGITVIYKMAGGG